MVEAAVTVGAVVEAVQGVEGVVGEGHLLQGGRQPLHQVRVGLVRVLGEAGTVTGASAVSGNCGRSVIIIQLMRFIISTNQGSYQGKVVFLVTFV